MTNNITTKPRKIFRPHPVFGWTLTPSKQVKVPFRTDIIQNIDELGNRYNPYTSSNSSAKTKLSIYGCSFTYGTGLADTETFAALLQQALPNTIITNMGVGGHSSVQSLLRFRADILENKVDVAIFGVISDHRYRNLPHPYRMKAYLSPDWYQIGVEQIPHARLNRTGNIDIEFTPIWQPSLLRNDFNIFLPDEHVLDLIFIEIFKEIISLANENKIKIVIALLDQLDSQFNQLMIDTFSEVHDISTPYNKTYTFIPDDIHPNQLANQFFSDQLLPIIKNTLI